MRVMTAMLKSTSKGLLLSSLSIISIVVLTYGIPNAPFTIIQGRVIDEANHPVSGARAKIVGGKEYTTTDKNGFFFINHKGNGGEVLIAAGKDGWYNDGILVEAAKTGVVIRLEQVPTTDNASYRFIEPKPQGMGMMGMMQMNCGSCHQRIYDEWVQSTMARTTHNRWLSDLYNGTDAEGKKGVSPGYRLDFPNSAGNCADCHAPSAALNDPGRTDLNQVLWRGGTDANGVHCDFCHKIREVQVSNRPGVQSITMNRLLPVGMMMMRPVFAYGPYVDVVTMPMVTSYNPLFEKSEFCSSCHQDATHLPKGKPWDYLRVYPEAGKYELYENGTVVPAQWTYQEWLEWQSSLPNRDPDKGRQCQDCHMNWRGKDLPYDEYIVGGMAKRMMGTRREPQQIHPHHFEGAEESRLRGAAYMQVDTEVRDKTLAVTVDLMNVNAGHRLPTGVSFRNMILIVSAVDRSGARLKFVSGSQVPDWGGVGSSADGNYAGHPGKGFAKILADAKGNQLVQDWQAARVASDNRIKPKETDTSVYTFELPSDTTRGSVTAALIYRRVFKPIADAKKWRLDDVVMREKEISF